VSHNLPFLPPEKDEKVNEAFIENRKRLSISGVQKKLSIKLDKNKLNLTMAGEHGQYILKPIPDDVRKPDQVPANEHLTMQMAEQIFNIQTAANGMIFFQDDQPAYITKRFDYRPDGSKFGMEDFAAISQKTKATYGVDFKYDASYEELFKLLKQYVGPYRIEGQKLFRLILFNYAFSNGDAHLKNFSLLETESGDYTMSPAYDLVNTLIHVDDTDFALTNKLFKDHFKSAHWKKTGQATSIDFIEFGKRIGVQEKRVKTLLEPFLEIHQSIIDLIGRSFLDEATKKTYLRYYQTKRNTLTK